MIKKTPNGIYISDNLTVDLSRIKPELKTNFVRKVQDFEEAGRVGVAPKLVVAVAATHAGLPTGNKAFYTPDRMRQGLPSYTSDFAKPVLLHHNDMKDPIGRVQRATYKDLSSRYVEPMKAFKERYGGDIFTDAKEKIDLDKAFDQVDWIIENMVPMKDYVGLGYGELDLHITDADAAQKIIDQRYLTVSVGFTTDSMYCSNCHQDWAEEGFCEHERGKVYDGKETLLIPGKFIYEEVSFINSPADSQAQVISISETPSLTTNTNTQVFETLPNSQDSKCVPILISVADGKVSRIDSFKKVTPERAQEVIDVKKQKDNSQDKAPELVKVKIDDVEVEFPTQATDLLEDAKRENYITDEVDGHRHRVIIDPETGNGYTTYDIDHGHEVVNRELVNGGSYDYNDSTGQSELKNPHTHELEKKVSPLTDDKEVADNATDEVVEDGRRKEIYKKVSDEGEDEIELEDDADVPEGYELWAGDAKDENLDPTSFELTDYESVVSALAAVDESDLTDSQKARTVFNINKKAKELEITEDLSEFDVVEIELVDPSNEDAKIKLAFTSEEGFTESFTEMTEDAVEANKDELEKACAVFGLDFNKMKDDATGAVGSPLTKAQAQAQAAALFNNINKDFVDNLIEGLNKLGSDEARKEIAAYIIDQMIAESIVDDFYADFNMLQKELQDTREKLAAVTKANRDFYASKQDDLARVVVALKVALKKPEFVDLNDEDLATRTKELKVRSVDSLQDSFSDLINEFSGKEVEPTDEKVLRTQVEPEVGTVVDSKDKTNNRQDMEIFEGMSDRQYALAMSLQNSFKNRS